jgi:hypothetical protein
LIHFEIIISWLIYCKSRGVSTEEAVDAFPEISGLGVSPVAKFRVDMQAAVWYSVGKILLHLNTAHDPVCPAVGEKMSQVKRPRLVPSSYISGFLGLKLL